MISVSSNTFDTHRDCARVFLKKSSTKIGCVKIIYKSLYAETSENTETRVICRTDSLKNITVNSVFIFTRIYHLQHDRGSARVTSVHHVPRSENRKPKWSSFGRLILNFPYECVFVRTKWVVRRTF